MNKDPFCSNQFTTTKYDSAEAKAKWANAMASWVERGFPENGWRKSLYIPLSRHLYGHIAHYNQYGFYAQWFDDIQRQLAWLEYVARGGIYGGVISDPAHTWSDVEQAFSVWVRKSGLLARYRQLCAADIEAAKPAATCHVAGEV